MNALGPIKLTIEFVKQQADPGIGTTSFAQTGDFGMWAIFAILFIGVITFFVFRVSRVFKGEYSNVFGIAKYAKNSCGLVRLSSFKAVIIIFVVGFFACISILATSAVAALNNSSSLIQPEKIQVAINEETGEVDAALFDFVNNTNDYYLFEKSSAELTEDAIEVSNISDWGLSIKGMNADLYNGEPSGDLYSIIDTVQTLCPGQTSSGTLMFYKINPEIAKQLIGKSVFNIQLMPNQYVIDVPKANTGLVFNNTLQYGVNEGVGYVLTGEFQELNAGIYTAIATPIGDFKWPDKSRVSVSIVWSIDKAIGGFNNAPVPTNPTYSNDNQNLVTAGSQIGDGVIVYKLKDSLDPYSTMIPQQTNVGVYTVLCHVEEGTNYTKSEDVEIKNCNITQAHIKKITINGSNKAMNYVQGNNYTFPEYSVQKEVAYSVEYEMQEGSPAKVFDDKKITPTKTGIDPVVIINAQEKDIGNHMLKLDTYTWIYNDANVVADGWLINDGALTINPSSIVNMSIVADKEIAYLGDTVTFTVTIENTTSEAISGGNLYINYDKKFDSIEIAAKSSVTKSIEYKVTSSDFLTSIMEKYFTFEIESIAYYNYASHKINLGYKNATPDPGYQGYYDSNKHTYNDVEGIDILGGEVEATNAGSFTVLLIIEPGYKWSDAYAYDYRIVNWQIKKINIDIHFNMHGETNFTTTFGSEWDVDSQEITYSTPSGQTVPSGEWPSIILGGTPAGSCSYTRGSLVGNYDVDVVLPESSSWSQNYIITSINSKLIVNKAELNISWPTQTFTYTGSIISIPYYVSGAYDIMQPKISYSTFDKETSIPKDFIEPGNYKVKASLISTEAINNNYVIKTGGEPSEIFSIINDLSFKPKAILMEPQLFETDYTLNFVYDNITYTPGQKGIIAVYDVIRSLYIEPDYGDNIYPLWHADTTNLSLINKVVFQSSFINFHTFTEESFEFDNMCAWFADMPNLSSVENFENVDTTYMKSYGGMFANSGSVNVETLNLSGMSKAEANPIHTCSYMFYNSYYKFINLPDDKTFSESPNAEHMFESCSNLVNIIGLSKLGEDSQAGFNNGVCMFKNCNNLIDLDVSDWHIAIHKFVNLGEMFYGCSGLQKISCKEGTDWSNGFLGDSLDMFTGCTSLPYYDDVVKGDEHPDIKYAKASNPETKCGLFSGPYLPLNAGKATIDENGILQFYVEGERIPINAEWDVPKNTKSESEVPWLIDGKEVIKDIKITENFNLWLSLHVASTSYWFAELEKITNLDISNWNTNKVTDMSSMFINSKLRILQAYNLDTSSVETMESMFRSSWISFVYGIETWDVSNTKSMSRMFMNSMLTSFSCSYWNTKNLENTSLMFSSGLSLMSVDIGHWKISNLENVYGMFTASFLLVEVNISEWSKFKDNADLDGMFMYCIVLNTIYCNGDWRNQNIRSANMFDNCTSLPNYTSSDVTKGMAYNKEDGGYFTKTS